MGGVVKGIGTGLGAIATGGTSLIPGSPTAKVGSTIGNVLTGGVGGLSGGGYTPQLLSNEDPSMMLAQSGGAPLLTQIALGASVDDALAGYFGKSSGNDFQQYYNSLSSDEKSAIDGVKNQLTQIQSNTDMRTQAVQKLAQDFPNVVSMTAPQVLQAKQQAGQDFDAASKGAMDLALSSVAAKYGQTGSISSGAATQAEALVGAQQGEQKLSYQTQQGNQALDLLGQGWQQQYNEANALQSFQQKMLGQGASQGFSAMQSMLQRNNQNAQFNANATNQKGMSDQASNNALLGAVGGLAGTAIGGAMAGPVGGAAGGAIGKAAASGGSSGNSFSIPGMNGVGMNSPLGIQGEQGGGYR